MIGYTTIGVSDMDRACSFYDGLLAEIGAKQLFGDTVSRGVLIHVDDATGNRRPFVRCSFDHACQ